MAIKTYVDKTINVHFYSPPSLLQHILQSWSLHWHRIPNRKRAQQKCEPFKQYCVSHTHIVRIVMLKCFRFWNGIFSSSNVYVPNMKIKSIKQIFASAIACLMGVFYMTEPNMISWSLFVFPNISLLFFLYIICNENHLHSPHCK